MIRSLGFRSGTLALGLLLAPACVAPKVGQAVSPLGPSPLLVEPAQATVSAGQGVDFKAKCQDGSTPSVTWEALDGGVVDASGRYAAPAAPGTYTVQAKAFGDRLAKAKVLVVAPPRGPVSAPEHVSVGAREVQASVPDQPGSTYAWTVEGGTAMSDPHAATFTFNAGDGPKVLLACKVVNAAGVGMTTSLEIPLLAGVSLTISPRTALMTAGTSRKFGYSLAGGLTGDVVWSVVEAGGGTVDAEGRYQAPARPGDYTVQVRSKDDPTVKDTLAVKVVAAPLGPMRAPAKVAAHATGLHASVPDQEGCTFAWKVTGGQITAGADGNLVTFEAGDGPTVGLECLVSNAAGESLRLTMDLPVGD